MRKNATEGIEIERKYIIKMPRFTLLSKEEKYTESEILQIYLKADDGVTRRIRRRLYPDRREYTETKKLRIDRMSATEIERQISEEEFTSFRESILEGTRPLSKTRHTFEYHGQLFEIDVYPEWRNTAIMETELESREQSVDFPPFIHILCEVTGDKRYSNASMSKAFPEEIDL